MKKILWRARLYVDGACIGNGKPGAPMGAGVVCYRWREGKNWEQADAEHRSGELGDWPIEVSQPLGPGTNNRAELLAVKIGLDLIPNPEETGVVILTDSEYVKCVLESRKRPNKNPDLIAPIRTRIKQCGYCYINWVKGHNINEGNIRADELAEEAARNQSVVRSKALVGCI